MSRFVHMDVLRTTLRDFRGALPDNYQVVVADPPWATAHVPKDHDKTTYALIDDDRMLDFFAERVRHLFAPTKADPIGYLFVWFTSDKLELAMQCLAAADYTYCGLNSWVKATMSEGLPHKGSQRRGNCECFLVGKKELVPTPYVRTFRALLAPPAVTTHSSKPSEFYTRLLPHDLYLPYGGKPWSKVHKVDIFRRTIEPGFVCVGNQYHGEDPIQSTVEAVDRSFQRLARAMKRPRGQDGPVGKMVRVAGVGAHDKTVYWQGVVKDTRPGEVRVQWKGTRTCEWVDAACVQ